MASAVYLTIDQVLELNHYNLDRTDDEIVMIESLAASTADQARFFEWVVAHAKPQDA